MGVWGGRGGFVATATVCVSHCVALDVLILNGSCRSLSIISRNLSQIMKQTFVTLHDVTNKICCI